MKRILTLIAILFMAINFYGQIALRNSVVNQVANGDTLQLKITTNTNSIYNSNPFFSISKTLVTDSNLVLLYGKMTGVPASQYVKVNGRVYVDTMFTSATNKTCVAWDTVTKQIVRTSCISTSIVPRVTTITSHATPTINTNNCDAVTITAQAEAITSMTTNLSGSPVNFQKLLIRIKDDGTARAITWGASFATGIVTLPSTTVLGKVLMVMLIYDSVTSKWVCQAAGSEQ